MSYGHIDPVWDREPDYITEGYSTEITAKDVEAFRECAHRLQPHTPVAITFLPGESLEARVRAAITVREMGLDPVPHFSARRLESEAELKTMIDRMVKEAGVNRCFAIAGDPSTPIGPYADTSALIDTGLFEANGFITIGVAGHPDGHPNMTREECFAVLKRKCDMIRARGMKPVVVTQFGFDPEAFMGWLKELRTYDIDASVRLGVPGPTNIKSLIKFAARCGVSASASVMAKYGVSLAKLIGSVGPDKMVEAFDRGFGPEHGRVRLHFYPFGGLSKTIDWVDNYTSKIR